MTQIADFISLSITAATQDEARLIAETLVDERLAACVTLVPNCESHYRWAEVAEQAEEVLLFAKSKIALFPAIEARVKSLHSYQCPCIVATPLCAGNQDYLDWIETNVKEPG